MPQRCPGCGFPLLPSDATCPRCELAFNLPPAALPGTVEPASGRLQERRVLGWQDREVRWSLRMLLVAAIGLVLLLFAVTAVIIWLAFGA